MTRILFLAQRVQAEPQLRRGGAASHAAVSLEALRRHFDVLPLFADPASEAAPSRGRRIRRLLPPRVRGLRQDVRLVLDDRQYVRRALAAAVTFRPELVYERNEYFALAGLKAARSLGVPLLLEVNGLLEFDTKSFYRSLGEPVGARLERTKCRRAGAIVTTSPTLAAELTARGAEADRIHVVPNSVASDRLVVSRPDAPRAGPTIVGWLGHGLAWHGLDLLAVAAELVAAEEPSVVYRIVGGGPAVEQLREHANAPATAARYEFSGVVSAAETPRLLADFDIGVIPANPRERFPIKLVEMGAAGAAVVAPLVPCITDFLRPGVDFEPVRPGDVADLARALLLLVRNSRRRLALAGSLEARVRADFTVDVAGKRLREIVDNLRARGR